MEKTEKKHHILILKIILFYYIIILQMCYMGALVPLLEV